MTLAERAAHIMAETERALGPLRDLKRSREQAVAGFADIAHSTLMDGAL